ncbi:hypothetical protein ACWDE0_07145 [Streptomyces sp. 900105755]
MPHRRTGNRCGPASGCRAGNRPAGRFGAEWIQRTLNGEFTQPGRDVRHYGHNDGRTTDGTANPTWRLGTTPTHITATRQA